MNIVKSEAFSPYSVIKGSCLARLISFPLILDLSRMHLCYKDAAVTQIDCRCEHKARGCLFNSDASMDPH